MEFRFDDDQLAMRDAVRALCADHLDLTRLAEREGKAADPAAWTALADLGVLGMLAGGDDAGVGLVEASIVFEALGAHLASGPVLWSTSLRYTMILSIRRSSTSRCQSRTRWRDPAGTARSARTSSPR